MNKYCGCDRSFAVAAPSEKRGTDYDCARMDLLERAEFFKQLQDTLAEVDRGQGRLVLVSSEAGIGKTSLVEQFVEKQKNQYRVLWGGCDAPGL